MENSYNSLSENILKCSKENLKEKLAEKLEKKYSYSEKNFANLKRLELIGKKVKDKEEYNKILLFGLNPASNEENKKDKEDGYIEYMDIENENKNLDKILKNPDYVNTGYFKPNYELFPKDTVRMTWTLQEKEIAGEINKDLEIDENIKETFLETMKKEIKQRENIKNILIFCDLIYYHDTKSENIKGILRNIYPNDIEDVENIFTDEKRW